MTCHSCRFLFWDGQEYDCLKNQKIFLCITDFEKTCNKFEYEPGTDENEQTNPH